MNTAPQIQAPGLDPTLASQLAQLRDIHLPSPVDWWPPAPGWWLLAAVVLAALVALIVLLVRRRRRRRYRRIALREARALFARWQQHNNTPAYLQAVNRLLKQTALVAYPRQQVASLNGPDWLGFLDAKLRRPRFTEPDLRDFAALYQAEPQGLAPETLHDAAQLWIRRHRC